MSFRARLVLAAAYLVTGVVLALEVPLALNVERRADADFQAAVLGRAAILSTRVSHLVATASRSSTAGISAQLARLVDESATSADERIVVTDDRGRVLADSAGEAVPRELYATPERPEFTAALFQGRIDYRRRQSETVGAELLLVTVPIVQADRVVGAVRVSASRSSSAASTSSATPRPTPSRSTASCAARTRSR